jgi:DNA-binding HxlR family transcriptional regulator
MRLMKNMCPRYQAAMEILGKRWTGLIVNVLLEGPKRFSALATRLELVSERMLSERLKELELHGIVQRHVLPDSPVRVQYDLTPKGRALSGVVSAIENWASLWVSVPDNAECDEEEHPQMDEGHLAPRRASSS